MSSIITFHYANARSGYDEEARFDTASKAGYDSINIYRK